MWRRLVVAGAVGVALAGVLAAPAAVAAPGDRIGTGKHTCLPGPKANCRDVIHTWKFQNHRDLSGAEFARAKLHGADLRGVNLTEANLRGVVLRYADLRGAKLEHADFSPAGKRTRIARATPPCRPLPYGPYCVAADLSGVNLTGANLSRANLTDVNLTGATLAGATLTGATLTGAIFCNTTMPDLTPNNSGC